MRKGMWSAATFITLVVGGIVVLGAPTLRAADTRVAMGSNNDPLKFLPPEITVPVNGTVQWFNETDIQHDISAEDGSFDSKGLLSRGQTFEFKFGKTGDFKYFCTPHKDAGMKGVVHVTAGGATPTTAAPTATTQPAAGATTSTTGAPAGASGASTSTTAKAGSAGNSTTTTTAATGVTSTTQAPSVTPTSGPDTAGESTTTSAAAAGGESAADHGSEGGADHKKKKNSPIGIAFASVSTLLLAAIAGKLLASKP